ncbi:MAG: DUF4091 domain-containing protein [Armatimonadetes bacterium]|nr:DUF4091 domain-containing protein [Armatimonadota bacterium]NIM23473.1 DUF4091 domain-containing protein [Armatimonadota bacterium]NIM67339.1 DUF4091 domain-containing protein [Armatimonadota bacterium]NIM75840.1 DUF4091 domain-containing protein [Armatimonadota bacterium]NIN05525.1 DUF4091 domain-containing protein [Armatimonadota bacterium]
MEAARGERLSFQVALRTDNGESPIITAAADAPSPISVQIRRVGYVPVPHLNTETPPDELEGADHIPGQVPDPLFPDSTLEASACETHAFWVTVKIPLEAAPGPYPVTVRLTAQGTAETALTAAIIVYPAVLPPRRNFPVTNFLHADALCDWYKVQPSQRQFWSILDPYLADLAAHGQDTMYVPLFTPPLDGVKRPIQLLGVSRRDGRYRFDWRLVRRWVEACRSHGLGRFEWTHFFTQWGAQYALRVYEGHGENAELLWPPDTHSLSPVYRDFLAQFLPKFKRFLRAEGLLECSLFHLSDEPHSDHFNNYRAAREMVRELAPWMRVIDALSDINFAREGLVDVPVPIVWAAPGFVREGFSPWVYYCCEPRGAFLNRLLDTPLIKVRMSGWLFYRTQVRGFLHWGYNYWYKRATTQLIEPFTVSDGLAWPDWAHGDPFVVYPGPEGPIDSLRWEIFAESLQDYALIQAAGIEPDDPLLMEIEDYADFPRSEEWLTRRRRILLERLARKQSAS